MHCHWAKSKPPDNSNGCIFFTLRLKLRYSVQLWQVFFNTVYPAQGFKIFCLFSRLLGICTLSSLGVLGFQLLQKLDPGNIGLIFWMAVCVSVCVVLCTGPETSFNIQISASLNNPSCVQVKHCSEPVHPGSWAKSPAYFTVQLSLSLQILPE